MSNPNRMAELGMLVGDPARAAMLGALMDGRALTARELAGVARIAPQAARGHLARLSGAGLLKVVRQGRHSYHRLAGADVARLLDGMREIAPTDAARPGRKPVTGPRDAAMRRARTCHDHFAGNLGVAIADALLERDIVAFDDEAGTVTTRGIEALRRAGIDLSDGGSNGGRVKAARSTRPMCRPCLDWSERRPHVAGKLGAAICAHYFAQGYARRINGTRALEITPPGRAALRTMFGVREAG